MSVSRESPNDEVLEVTIEDVVFRSADGRYAVVRGTREPASDAVLRAPAADDEITVVGDLGTVSPGETLRVTGRWKTHPQFGRQLAVSSFAPVMPTSRAGVTRYLGSGLVPGIGPALAARLVQKFGHRTLDVIANEPARLTEVPGIGKKRAEAIAAVVRSRRSEAEALSFLHGVGLGKRNAAAILKRYGDDAVRVVREDPYLVAEEVHGIGFRTADRVGRTAGIADDDPRRAAGAVLHVLGRAADEGHVFLPLDELERRAVALSVPEDRIAPAVAMLAERSMVIVDDDAVYPPPLHAAEVDVARLLDRLAHRPPRALGEAARAKIAAIVPGTLTETQRAVVLDSVAHGLVVLTGGPGTGKTTTVRAIVDAHEALGRKVLLCAPTGRAAKRMTEATGREARTIHRALEWNPGTGGFGRNAHAPLPADLVLVDEASMLDVRLAQSLFDAVPPSSTLVLVGDVDQLPPVGPGQVLRELIDSGKGHVVRLHEIFRQAQRSAIVRGAHDILHGRMPTPTPAGTKGEGDFFFVRTEQADAIGPRITEVLRRVSRAYGLDPKRDVQVLSPMRRGPAGTERLNELVQAELNPGDGAPGVMRPGDKVMQLKNDYERDVFNGDLGEVSAIEGGITYVDVDGREVQYDDERRDALTLAYASTIHKVQGSEFPAIVIALHTSHYVLLSRALLYTAITRAKKLAVVVGDDRALRHAVRNAKAYESYSRLAERLRSNRGRGVT